MSGSAFHDPTGPAPETRSARFLWLLFGASAAPLFWLGQVMVDYGVTTHICYPGDRPVMPPMTGALAVALTAFNVIALAGCAAGTLVSWRIWRRIGKSRSHFLALWGLMSSLWFSAAILFNVIALAVVPACLF